MTPGVTAVTSRFDRESRGSSPRGSASTQNGADDGAKAPKSADDWDFDADFASESDK